MYHKGHYLTVSDTLANMYQGSDTSVSLTE